MLKDLEPEANEVIISSEFTISNREWVCFIDLVTFTEKIVNGKLHFLCSVNCFKIKLNADYLFS